MTATATAVVDILIVDDDDDIRQLVSDLLRLSGYRPRAVASGVEALAALRGPDRAIPALVLLDVQMPVLDGWDTLRELRLIEGIGEVPVILCTVKATAESVVAGWSLGCDGYLPKPFDIEALLALVREVLGRTQAERHAHRAVQLALARRLL